METLGQLLEKLTAKAVNNIKVCFKSLCTIILDLHTAFNIASIFIKFLQHRKENEKKYYIFRNFIFPRNQKERKNEDEKKTSLLLKLHGQTWYRWIPQILTHVEYANGFRLGN